MSISSTAMRNAGAPQPAGAASEDQRATQRRDVMRATRAAREQQRGEFERALERAHADEGDEPDAPASTTVPVLETAPRTAKARIPGPDAIRDLDVRRPSSPGLHPGCESPATHIPLVPPPRNTATPEDATRLLRDPQAPADTHRWRFELADTTLPVQRLELQRQQGGTLRLALTPRQSRHAAPAELALTRLQQRLAACGGEPADLRLHSSPPDDPFHDET